MLVTGLEFDELPAEEKLAALQSMSVFCRVEPSHKQRLVEMLKAQVLMLTDAVCDLASKCNHTIGALTCESFGAC